jgi:hypothetical protein
MGEEAEAIAEATVMLIFSISLHIGVLCTYKKATLSDELQIHSSIVHYVAWPV